MPEPGGKVLARSIGRNPVWERDFLHAPAVEDRIQWRIAYKSIGGARREIAVEGNPWGAYRVEEAAQPFGDFGIERTAGVTPDGWTFEATLPFASLDFDWSAPSLTWQATRIRSRRALAPEFQWRSEPATIALSREPRGAAPSLKPLRIGNVDPPLEIGRVPRLPAVTAEWDHEAWRGVPAFELPRNETNPGPPRYRTSIKWMHDGRTLALLARMTEPEPVVARNGGRDSAVTADDHLAIYLATSGSALVEAAVNPVGAIRDSVASGPRITSPRPSWNARVETQTDIRHGHWILRMNIPLDQCAEALGEIGVPTGWRILVVRHRAPRPGEPAEWSTLPALQGRTAFLGPARYRSLTLRDADPTRVRMPDPVPRPESALASLDARVWSISERRIRAARNMVADQQRGRVEQAVLAEREAWEKVRTKQDWERFRDTRIRRLRESTGVFPPARPDLRAQVTARREGNGYRLENVVYQIRPDYWMPANLYLPRNAPAPYPAIVIVHSQHYPKTQGELHDMGELWARAGCAVLILERPGYGERAETTPWYRQAYGARYNYTKQLFLIGESSSGWTAWDVIRSVDFLHARSDIDKQRIILLGSVAGGGEIAGVAAALDERIAAVAPFNFDQGHVRVHGDSPGQISGQFSPWLVAASVAPRKFIRAFEFGWEGAEEPDYPNLWFDGMERSRKVWDFYGAAGNLTSSQAYGLIRLSMERVSHCFSIGPQQRLGIYDALNRWFGIPYPSKEDLAILPDSDLSVNPVREEARRQEAARRRPLAELTSITPAVAAGMERKATWQLAWQMGANQLDAARKRGRSIAQLRAELQPMLGDIEPNPAPRVESSWTREAGNARVEALTLTVENGIHVPLLLLRPPGNAASPVVVGIAQEGKGRFLANRSRWIETLLAKGISVCLPDLRATGETAPAIERVEGGAYQRIAQTEFDLGRSLPGARLKDLRTVLAYLRSRSDIDRQRIALWGDSFTPPNPAGPWLDELENEGGPVIQLRAEPMGAHLALLAGMYEDGVKAVVARGGLASYLSVLESAFAYVPLEDIVLGILKAGDVADIAAALSPRPLLLDGPVNGRNVRLDAAALDRTLAPTRDAYRRAGAASRLSLPAVDSDPAAWLAANF